MCTSGGSPCCTRAVLPKSLHSRVHTPRRKQTLGCSSSFYHHPCLSGGQGEGGVVSHLLRSFFYFEVPQSGELGETRCLCSMLLRSSSSRMYISAIFLRGRMACLVRESARTPPANHKKKKPPNTFHSPYGVKTSLATGCRKNAAQPLTLSQHTRTYSKGPWKAGMSHGRNESKTSTAGRYILLCFTTLSCRFYLP